MSVSVWQYVLYRIANRIDSPNEEHACFLVRPAERASYGKKRDSERIFIFLLEEGRLREWCVDSIFTGTENGHGDGLDVGTGPRYYHKPEFGAMPDGCLTWINLVSFADDPLALRRANSTSRVLPEIAELTKSVLAPL